jgi:antitoxin component YwqK of YwqJK toxin-antitoxin module
MIKMCKMTNTIIGYASIENYILVLEIDPFLTDLNRSVFDKNYAIYKTSKSLLKKIYDKDTKEVNNELFGEIFDSINKSEINFYLTEDPAFFCNKIINTGLHRTWDDDGKLLTENNYLNGKQHGHSRYYNKNELMYIEHHTDGVLDGEQKYYFKNKLIAIQKFKNGIMIDNIKLDIKSDIKIHKKQKMNNTIRI